MKLKVTREGRLRRGWRREPNQTDMLRQLGDRELTTIERCQVAWEEELDPVAVVAAMIHSELPVWLKNAVLVLLDVELPGRAKLWRQRKAHMRDRVRVEAYLRALDLRPNLTSDLAALVAQGWVQQLYPEERAHHFGADAMKSTVRRVRSGLQRPGRYQAAPAEVRAGMDEAFGAFIALVEARVRAKKDSKRKA